MNEQQKTKVREFWIHEILSAEHGYIPVAFEQHKNLKDSIHVIEYLAYQLCVEALKVYADRKTINAICNGTGKDYDEDENGFYAGKFARETLKELGIEVE